MLNRTAIIALIVSLAPLGRLAAQEAKPPAKAAPAKAEAMKVTVVSVTGVAHKRLASDANGKWAPLKTGDVLSDMTLVRTGLRTKVVLDFADRGRVMIRRATKIGIGEFRKEGNLAKARLGLKYGSMRARVDSSRGPNDFRVAMPVATLSVRGSGANLGYSDWGMGFCVIQHEWDIKVTDGREKHVREGRCTDENLSFWHRLVRKQRHVKMGPTDNGQTDEENDSLADNGDGRAIFDYSAGMGGTSLMAPDSSCQHENGYENGFDYNDYPGGFPGEYPNGYPNGMK